MDDYEYAKSLILHVTHAKSYIGGGTSMIVYDHPNQSGIATSFLVIPGVLVFVRLNFIAAGPMDIYLYSNLVIHNKRLDAFLCS